MRNLELCAFGFIVLFLIFIFGHMLNFLFTNNIFRGF